jgi:hypothetical protein
MPTGSPGVWISNFRFALVSAPHRPYLNCTYRRSHAVRMAEESKLRKEYELKRLRRMIGAQYLPIWMVIHRGIGFWKNRVSELKLVCVFPSRRSVTFRISGENFKPERSHPTQQIWLPPLRFAWGHYLLTPYILSAPLFAFILYLRRGRRCFGLA